MHPMKSFFSSASPWRLAGAFVCALIFSGLAGQSVSAAAAPLVAGTGPSTQLEIVDVGERTYEDGPALSVSLSQPLATDRRYDAFLHVHQGDGGLVKGAW